MRSAVALAGGPLAVPPVGLTKMGRAETEKISQDAGILFFQGKEFLARSQAAFHFHGTSRAYSPDKFMADVDGFGRSQLPAPAGATPVAHPRSQGLEPTDE
jgi:hypothetical protein